MDYSIIKPQRRFIVLKEAKEKERQFKVAGQSESNAYGKIVAIAEDSKFELGQLVVYNEFEGQELMKYGKITEDNIIIISEDNILAIIE